MSDAQAGSDSFDPSDDVILEVRNATVSFGMERGTSRVLDDVSLDVRRNEILGVVGESGSGKSMFASSLLDAVVPPGQLSGDITYYPTEGEAVNILDLDEESLYRDIRWEEISMVFQGAMSSFNPTMKIRGHFKETAKAHGYPLEEAMDRAKQLIADLYMDPERVMDSYPHELSGGMQQRTLIALALVLEPRVLVMDEPTAALDLLMQRSIMNLIYELKEKYGLTVIFITHDLPIVSGLADRLAVMYAFQFVEVGPTDQIVRDATHPYTRALLQAVPNKTTPLDEMQPIPGNSPDPVDVPAGCSYHPRCPLADEVCRDEDPELLTARDDHRTACHYWEDAADAIPFSFTRSEDDT